ncbi:ADP-ribosylglycohydrolase family protein [Candidatus Enterococcus ferrettii]|uniref:ADP-ribosylglycohydrolase n=1 Tax=Candidatus Enterococcus ferrettii TaxID=2815324 RepID=A0ABV0EW24_9ENTE|nr:ADP-ribosylglycohydrolase family protein [Enterococcus sp. 665A]MBO1342622.1 ADP-ribosylglycohydrolase family protein [Enterococcus sp. 665A]
MEQLTRRLTGVLIGGALGDAMGMPTELWTQQMIYEEFPKGVTHFVPAMNKGAVLREMAAGQVTDDTINTKFIIDMLVKHQGVIDVENYIEQLRIWSKDSQLAELVSGPSTRKALAMMDEGVPLSQTGRFGTTNGAAMKIAPIGLLTNYQNLPDLVEKVQQICIPTHNTSVAIAGASSVAAAISYVASGRREFNEMLEIAKQAIRLGMTKGYDVASASLIRRIEAVNELVKTKEERVVLSELYELWGTGVETIETIPCVFAIVKLAKGNPLKAALLAANLGGDTDTIGAIAAAICGGINPEFSPTIINKLETVNGLNFRKMAESILSFSPYYKEE